MSKILIGRAEEVGLTISPVEIGVGKEVSLVDGDEVGVEEGLGVAEGLGETPSSPGEEPSPRSRTVAVTTETENTKTNKTANKVRVFLFNQIPTAKTKVSLH